MKKVGIVTFNDAYNYGAFLQVYALQCFLKNNGIKAQVIDYKNNNFEQLYKFANNIIKRQGMENKFKILYTMFFRPSTYRARLNKSKKFFKCYQEEIVFSKKFEENTDEICDCFDYYIAGSDQVWNVRMTEYNLFYLLDFVKNPSKKISYAASFGRVEFDEKDINIFKKYIGDFKEVLVRENSGKKLLAERCKIESEVVLDPTFLLEQDEWKEFKNKSGRKKCYKKYVLIYIVSLPTNLYQAAIKYAEERQLEIVLLGRNSGITINGRRLQATVDVGPYEFVDYIINAEAIFTTSFHGTIFSINLKKPFYYELSRELYNNNARLIDIINLLDIPNREIVSEVVSDCDIDWVNVHEKLRREKEKSKMLLLKSMNMEGQKV